MRLLQRVQTYLRNPEPPSAIELQLAHTDERVRSSRSKRSQIRDVLRQYERGSLKEAETVEQLLKILR
jgi:predicted transcriptional regulator